MSETTSEADWRELAEDLQSEGDIPERQAQVVALIEAGLTHQETADEIGIERGNVSTHVRRYRETRETADWLAEHGPEV